MESWVLPRLDIRLAAVQSLGLERFFFPALAFFFTCYLSLGFSSKVTPQNLYSLLYKIILNFNWYHLLLAISQQIVVINDLYYTKYIEEKSQYTYDIK